MVDDCTHFYGNSRRAGFHDPCGFVTDTYITDIHTHIATNQTMRKVDFTSEFLCHCFVLIGLVWK